ncbi:MAG: HAD-IA family hydrolase [Muribaculaceae bacterium]|nr:HAD-IA family hydrolase [Muribaculaceae bacterium]
MYNNEIDSFLERHNYVALEPRAALIDMDGTLYDSMPNHAEAWMKMVSEIGISACREEFFMYEGRTGASTINLLFNREFGRDATEAEIKELYHRKTVYFNELPPVEPMPGAAELLRFLEQVGMKRVLVTGSGQSSLISRLEHDFPGAFTEDMMVTGRDVTHGKPAPDPFLMAMKKAGVSPAQSIVIENAPLGVEAGDAAGAFTIGVTTGPIPGAALKNAGAAIVFDDMRTLADQMPFMLYALSTQPRNLN